MKTKLIKPICTCDSIKSINQNKVLFTFNQNRFIPIWFCKQCAPGFFYASSVPRLILTRAGSIFYSDYWPILLQKTMQNYICTIGQKSNWGFSRCIGKTAVLHRQREYPLIHVWGLRSENVQMGKSNLTPSQPLGVFMLHRTGSVQKMQLLDSCFCRFKQMDIQRKRPECIF